MFTKVKVGEQFPDLVHIGDVLPVGSVVATGPNHTRESFTQQAPHTWVSDRNQLMSPGYLTITQYLRDAGGADEVTLPPETAASFLWRLRDTAITAAELSGISRHDVVQMAAEFGAPKPLFRVGGVVANGTDVERLPVGAVVYAGHPAKSELLSVWTQFEDGLRHTFGPAKVRQTGQVVTIFSLPGQQELINESVASEDELARIALRVWRVGKRYQRRHRWCGVFDQTLASLGFTPQVLSGLGAPIHGPGDVVDRESAALLPEGSLLAWVWQRGWGFAIYRRDNSARNRSRTRRVFGWEDNGEQSHARMTVLQIPNEEMVWHIQGRHLRHLPDGVRFVNHVDGIDLTLGENRSDIDPWQQYSVRGWVE